MAELKLPPANMSVGYANQLKGLNPDGTPLAPGEKPYVAPVIPTATVAPTSIPTVATPLTDAEVATLGTQGYREGDIVPGKGRLLPDGTFAPIATTDTLAGQNATNIASSSTGTGTVVSTSAPEVSKENETIAKVQNLTADDTALTKAHNDYLAMIERRQTALDARRIAEEASIGAEFDIKGRRLGEAQVKEKGTVTSTLARIGGYLGESASATGALVNLNEQHQYQVNDLEAKRQSAIQEARNAISDKDFELAKLKATEANDYVKEIRRSKQDFFENSIKLLQEARAEETQKRQTVTELMKAFTEGGVDPTAIPKATQDRIDAFYGVPGFTVSSIATANKVAAAKTQKEVIDAQTATVNLLQKIPAGMPITLNGKQYVGIGDSADITTTTETDNNGKVTLIAYNKVTGKINTKNLGQVGKTTTGTGDGTAAERALQGQIEMSKLFEQKFNGKPVIGENLKATPEAFNAIIDKSPLFGLTRDQAIQAFGSKIYDRDKKDWYIPYKLNPNEVKLITGIAE